jgi:hypothetical protein
MRAQHGTYEYWLNQNAACRLGQAVSYVACLVDRRSDGPGSAHEAGSWIGPPGAFEPSMMTFTLPRWDVETVCH